MDELAAALHSLGWSCGDVAFRIGDRVVWQFYGARGEQRVIVHAKLVPKMTPLLETTIQAPSTRKEPPAMVSFNWRQSELLERIAKLEEKNLALFCR